MRTGRCKTLSRNSMNWKWSLLFHLRRRRHHRHRHDVAIMLLLLLHSVHCSFVHPPDAPPSSAALESQRLQSKSESTTDNMSQVLANSSISKNEQSLTPGKEEAGGSIGKQRRAAFRGECPLCLCACMSSCLCDASMHRLPSIANSVFSACAFVALLSLSCSLSTRVDDSCSAVEGLHVRMEKQTNG